MVKVYVYIAIKARTPECDPCSVVHSIELNELLVVREQSLRVVFQPIPSALYIDRLTLSAKLCKVLYIAHVIPRKDNFM